MAHHAQIAILALVRILLPHFLPTILINHELLAIGQHATEIPTIRIECQARPITSSWHHLHLHQIVLVDGFRHQFSAICRTFSTSREMERSSFNFHRIHRAFSPQRPLQTKLLAREIIIHPHTHLGQFLRTALAPKPTAIPLPVLAVQFIRHRLPCPTIFLHRFHHRLQTETAISLQRFMIDHVILPLHIIHPHHLVRTKHIMEVLSVLGIAHRHTLPRSSRFFRLIAIERIAHLEAQAETSVCLLLQQRTHRYPTPCIFHHSAQRCPVHQVGRMPNQESRIVVERGMSHVEILPIPHHRWVFKIATHHCPWPLLRQGYRCS